MNRLPSVWTLPWWHPSFAIGESVGSFGDKQIAQSEATRKDWVMWICILKAFHKRLSGNQLSATNCYLPTACCVTTHFEKHFKVRNFFKVRCHTAAFRKCLLFFILLLLMCEKTLNPTAYGIQKAIKVEDIYRSIKDLKIRQFW